MRYFPLTPDDRRAMRAEIGIDNVDALFPSAAKAPDLEAFPDHQGEHAVKRHMRSLAAKNLASGDAASFLGCGAYKHDIPALVDHIVQRSEFMTSYTPYQAEIAQGTLQYLFEFQTQICRLSGMEIANASMYDGSTACAEAAIMASRITRRSRIILHHGVHPHYTAVVRNYFAIRGNEEVISAEPLGPELCIEDIDEKTACVILQYPDILGRLPEMTEIVNKAKTVGALVILCVTEIVALGLLQTPASLGADIFVAEGQSIGNALCYGGPYLGLFATKKRFMRQIPGRVVGETKDVLGKRGYVLTLSTREQHIRRESATSNICSNSGLCALAFSAHMSLLGRVGLKRLALLNHARAAYAFERFAEIEGVKRLNEHFFNEFALALPCAAAPLIEDLGKEKILAGVALSRFYRDKEDYANILVCAFTECCEIHDIDFFLHRLAQYLKSKK